MCVVAQPSAARQKTGGAGSRFSSACLANLIGMHVQNSEDTLSNYGKVTKSSKNTLFLRWGGASGAVS